MITHTATSPDRKFKLGQLVATPGAIAALTKSGDEISVYIQRHRCCDWGDVPPEDAKLNDEAVAHEGNPDQQGRVLSSYRTSAGDRIWLITEFDRTVTTMLLPEEY